MKLVNKADNNDCPGLKTIDVDEANIKLVNRDQIEDTLKTDKQGE
jgi:hypothetical protein